MTRRGRHRATTGLRRRDRFVWRLGLIAAGALVLRATYAIAIAGNHFSPGFKGDVIFYHAIASLIADGHGFIQPYAWQLVHQAYPTAEHPPLWPLLLAGAAKLGGHGLLAERLVGVPIGVGAVAAIGVLGRRIGGDRVGLIAAGIAAAHPLLVAADGSGMSETLYGLCVLLALLAALTALERPSVRRAALAGAAVGLASLTRGEGLLLVALLLVPVGWAAAKRGRTSRILAAVLAAVVVIAPWTIRNYATFHAFVPVATNDATTLSGANCPRTYHGRDLGFWRVECRSVPHETNEAKQAAIWRREGLRYAGRHAGRLVAVVMPVRVLRTWGFWQPVRQVHDAEGRDPTIQAMGVIGYFVMLPLALSGALRLRRSGGRLWLLLVPAVLVTLVSALTYGYDRFRHVSDLAEVVLAAVAIAELRWPRGAPRPQRSDA